MLSRVLKEDAAGAQPVAWRRELGNKSGSPRKALGEAMSEAAQLRLRMAELQQAAELQAREAYENGVRAGEAAARKELESRVQDTLEKLAATISEIAATRSETIHRAEADTVHLTLAIARRVLHREISLNPSVLEDLIKAALEKMQAQEVYRVRVHPQQEEIMKRCLEETARGQVVTVVPDPTQAEGGAVFETNRGLLDASLDTQLDEIERILADQLEAQS